MLVSLEMAEIQQRRRWYHVRWFSEDDTKDERRLIVKLDFLIVPYAFLAYWTKYIDQANISKLGLSAGVWKITHAAIQIMLTSQELKRT